MSPPQPDAAPPTGAWVLLSYRLPREPSTPRITLWRKLRRLGAVQLGDGLVALPADPHTREQLEWLADEVVDAGGSAGIWLASPATLDQERELARAMADARQEEYAAILAEAGAARDLPAADRARAAARLRGELRRIDRRDYFPPPNRDAARSAVADLAGEPVPGPREQQDSDCPSGAPGREDPR